MNTRSKLSLIACFLMLTTAFTQAQIRLPNILGSNMVLQRNRQVPIWGWATAGKSVTVKFGSQQKSAVAGADGYWKVTLSPLKASFDAQSMTIVSDTSKIELTNILVGEVWLGGGQSNMEYLMKLAHAKPAKGVDSAALELNVTTPQIRLFKVEKKLSLPDVTTTGWHESGGVALAQFSAPAYYFARRMYYALHVPVGMIASSWGGSRIEPWTPASAYEALPAFKNDVATKPLKIDSIVPGLYYASMIKPLAPFSIRGVIWYQGESNCIINDSLRYADKFEALVNTWRTIWINDKMPFYSVLIAPHTYTHRKDHVKHTVYTLPQFWEAQMQTLKVPYTDIINVSDLVDNLNDIHPSYKWEVGRRLWLVVANKEYGYKNTPYSGPRFKGVQIKGSKAIITFNFADGLKTSDGKPVDNFTIAGADGKYVPAVAEISGNTVTVSSPQVSKPANVRFAWIETAMPNLTNASGLPAFSFRTDEHVWSYVKN